MRNIIYILLLPILFASCVSEKNFKKFHEKYETKAATNCAAWYPSVASVVEKEKYIQGEDIFVPSETQYVTVNCDSVEKSKKSKDKIVKIKVPGPTRVDTVVKERLVTKVDSALVSSLRGQLQVSQKKSSDTETKLAGVEKTRNRLWLSLGALLATIVGVFVVKNARWA